MEAITYLLSLIVGISAGMLYVHRMRTLKSIDRFTKAGVYGIGILLFLYVIEIEFFNGRFDTPMYWPLIALGAFALIVVASRVLGKQLIADPQLEPSEREQRGQGLVLLLVGLLAFMIYISIGYWWPGVAWTPQI